VSRPDSARGDDRVELLGACLYLDRDLVDLVTQVDHPTQLHPDVPKQLDQQGRVGVADLAGQDLVTDDQRGGGGHRDRIYGSNVRVNSADEWCKGQGARSGHTDGRR
jgi:hypothetical protein